jgi:hypothetical protein
LGIGRITREKNGKEESRPGFEPDLKKVVIELVISHGPPHNNLLEGWAR